MASLGTIGQFTSCPRCESHNAVVRVEEADGACERCLHCGWYGYPGLSPVSNGGSAQGPETREEREEMVLALSS